MDFYLTTGQSPSRNFISPGAGRLYISALAWRVKCTEKSQHINFRCGEENTTDKMLPGKKTPGDKMLPG